MSLASRVFSGESTISKTESKVGQRDEIDWVGVGLEIVKFTVVTGISVYFAYNAQRALMTLVESFDDGSKASATVTRQALAKRLKRPDVTDMTFDSYELKLLSEILGPDEITVSFEDIGGMEEQLEEVKDNVVLPMQLWSGYRAMGPDVEVDLSLSSCPTGILLYGLPGTGKSLTAKAIAKESGATFLNIKASSIMDKYLGESDKMVSAIFRVARKLAPTVVFIDEIDTVLRKRGGGLDNAGVQSMQGVFLAEWDGLNQDNRSTEIVVNEASNVRIHENNSALTAKEKNDRFMAQAPVVVLGATNRPTDLDAAFLRRMPVQIQTHMPDLTARVKIFRAQLLRDAIADDVDLAELAAATHNFSGSDIRELIRVAKQQRAKQVMHSAKAALAMVTDASEKNNNNNNNNKNNNSSSGSPVGKAISKEHFMFALSKSVSSASSTKNFGTAQKKEEVNEKFAGIFNSLVV